MALRKVRAMTTISPLSCYTRISPNKSTRGGRKVVKFTPHHMAGNLSIEACGQVFASSSRQASANYGISGDGRIGCYVPEEYRAWTSANKDNDQQAITVEVANDEIGGNWHVSDAAFNSLVALAIDVCKRYGLQSLRWTGDRGGTITSHDMFVATTCMGPYLKSKMPELQQRVNEALGSGGNVPDVPVTPPSSGGTGGTGFGGVYVCQANGCRVRNAPSLSGAIMAQYNKGQKVVLDDWYTSADGYIWGRYTGASSGQKRYVAVGRATGKPEADDLFIKEGGTTVPLPDLGDTDWWGCAYSKELQSQLGTTVDGIISGQAQSNAKYFWAVDKTSIKYGTSGSNCIRALQTKLNALGYNAGAVDGHYGKGTITAHQRFLIDRGYSVGNTGADGLHGTSTNKAMASALYAGAYR